MTKFSALKLTTLLLMNFHVGGCGEEKNSNSGDPNLSSDAVHEYRMLASEFQLARAGKPYLVLDVLRRKIQLKMGVAEVWSHPLVLEASREEAFVRFAAELTTDKAPIIRYLADKHLFASQDQTPDSVLSIVGRAMHVDPELIQRDIPEKFQLVFDDGFVMEFRSEIEGDSRSAIKNTFVNASTAVRRLLGGSYLVTSMDPHAAMTLYRAAYDDIPLLTVAAKS